MISVANGSEEIDVLIDGVVVAHLPRRNSGMAMTDILFHKSGATHFAFAISLDGVETYRLETTQDVRPGDMLSASFGYGATSPRAWDSFPNLSAPSLIPGDPCRVWCWFRPSIQQTDFFYLNVWGREDERPVRWRLWRRGYSIKQRGADGNNIRLQVTPPAGWSVLEGYLEVKEWKEVSSAHFHMAVN